MISYLEEEFIRMLDQSRVSGFVRQHRFAPPRQWRLDFAWVDIKLGVEIDGGIYRKLGHQTLKGMLNDAEKAEALLQRDWTLYRIPGPWLVKRDRRIWRHEIITTIELLKTRLGKQQKLPACPRCSSTRVARTHCFVCGFTL